MLSSILHTSSGDWVRFVEDMDALDLLKPSADRDELAKDLHSEMGTEGLSNFKRLLQVLAKLGLKYKFTLPPYFVLVVRSLATLEGIALQLDEDFEIIPASVPVALSLVATQSDRGAPALLEEFLLNSETGKLRDDRVLQVLRLASSKELMGFRKSVGAFCRITMALRRRPAAVMHLWWIALKALCLKLLNRLYNQIQTFVPYNNAVAKSA